MEMELIHDPTAEDIDFVTRGLKAFNDAIVGDDDHRPLTLVAKDGRGNIIAGLVGGTYWRWLNIDRFWVKEEYRKQGLGTRLLREAEKEALARGCRNAHLDTHDFQALGFYRKNGYRIKGELADLPPGHRRYLLWKKLA